MNFLDELWENAELTARLIRDMFLARSGNKRKNDDIYTAIYKLDGLSKQARAIVMGHQFRDAGYHSAVVRRVGVVAYESTTKKNAATYPLSRGDRLIVSLINTAGLYETPVHNTRWLRVDAVEELRTFHRWGVNVAFIRRSAVTTPIPRIQEHGWPA